MAQNGKDKAGDIVVNNGAGKKKKMMIIGIIAALLLVGAGGGWFYMTKMHEADDSGDEDKPKKKAKKDEKDIYVTLEPFVVNIRSSQEEENYLQVGFDVKVDSAETGEEVKKKMPSIRNKVLLLLSSKTTDELKTVDGKQKLNTDIRKTFNDVLGYKAGEEGGVLEVAFTSFVIQ